LHPDLIAKLVILLSIANGTPVLLNKVLHGRFAHPIDAGLRFVDGRRLFGPSKTVRGVVACVILTAAAAPLLGLEPIAGTILGGMAVAGDLVSSFLKRRLALAPSSQAIGLDQIPESLLPVLACTGLMPLTVLDIVIAVAVFTVGAILLSPVFHRVGLRDRPF
jgi:CDP-2,3-bis-(O-geranylgeranyl)-sn-glycerol synthase